MSNDMTPAEAARAVAEDYDLIGVPSADWMATAWRRFADKLDPPEPEPELCTCGHPRVQHMSETGPCCHLELKSNKPGIQLTCESCLTFMSVTT